LPSNIFPSLVRPITNVSSLVKVAVRCHIHAFHFLTLWTDVYAQKWTITNLFLECRVFETDIKGVRV
jgi:hypothetical protein